MFTLAQSVRIRGSAGEPLPSVFAHLERIGFLFRQGQLALVVSGPGTGKSAFALTVALVSEVATLYFSADSDAFIQATRALARLAGLTMEQAEKVVNSGDLSEYEQLLDKPIRFRYDAAPSIDDIERSMSAYREVYGEYPTLVIVDNLLDVMTSGDEDNRYSGQQDVLQFLNTLARTTGACVLVLHHSTGPFNDADKPIPLSGVRGQLTQTPAQVLTLHKEPKGDTGEWADVDGTVLRASPVKNRGGRADPSGFTFAELRFDGDRMLITDV